MVRVFLISKTHATRFFPSHIITHILLAPLLGAVAILFLPRKMETAVKSVALAASLASFALAVWLFLAMDNAQNYFQFIEYAKWIPSFNIAYHVGVDGIALLLVALTTFTVPIALLFSWGSVTKRIKEYYFLMLILEIGTLGVFVSLDTILFYVFWEIVLIPMYFIIGVWGGERRIYASVKFFLFTIVGSLFMLVAILWLGFQNTVFSKRLYCASARRCKPSLVGADVALRGFRIGVLHQSAGVSIPHVATRRPYRTRPPRAA